ncbi:hypothetical protein K1719_043479 [Acacia pycnantha]|nr:hypothetical protein K1719_043479 [Acacia pycnantha]
MYFPSGKLLVPLFLLTVFYRNSKALDGHQNCSSLCGDHNISSPFRLKDFPEKCGDHRYNLSCEQNQLVMYWQSGKYRVLSINYEKYTIRVRDANIVELDSSSLPGNSLTDYNFSVPGPYTSPTEARYEHGTWLGYRLNTNMIYVRCERPLDSPGFVDTAPCFRTSNGSATSTSSSLSSSYSYVNVGSETLWDLGLDDDCGIQLIYITSRLAPKNSQSWSCTDIHNMLLGGFELSWLNSFCQDPGDSAYLQGKEPYCDGKVPFIDFSFLGSSKSIN